MVHLQLGCPFILSGSASFYRPFSPQLPPGSQAPWDFPLLWQEGLSLLAWGSSGQGTSQQPRLNGFSGSVGREHPAWLQKLSPCTAVLVQVLCILLSWLGLVQSWGHCWCGFASSDCSPNSVAGPCWTTGTQHHQPNNLGWCFSTRFQLHSLSFPGGSHRACHRVPPQPPVPFAELLGVRRFRARTLNYSTLLLEDDHGILYVGARGAIFALNSSDVADGSHRTVSLAPTRR